MTQTCFICGKSFNNLSYGQTVGNNVSVMATTVPGIGLVQFCSDSCIETFYKVSPITEEDNQCCKASSDCCNDT